MWTCKQCDEQIEDQFDSCWKCGHADDWQSGGVAVAAAPARHPGLIQCPRCHCNLDYGGTKSFRTGSRFSVFMLGFLGPIGDLLESREVFDVYFCPQCGRVELFIKE